MNKLPDIIYLHGLGSSPNSNKARLVLEYLRSLGHHTEAPHLSVPSLEQLSVHEAIKTAAATIHGRSKEQGIIVIGSSFGGFVALHTLASLAPPAAQRVRGVVLLAPALYPWHPTSGIITAGVESEWERRGVFPIQESATGSLVGVHVGFIRELKLYDSDSVALGIPTLIIHGDKDEVVPVSQSQEFSAKRPGVNLVTLSDSHELLAHPATLLELVSHFVTSCSID